jgi:nitrogen fixation protein FixH
MIGTTNAARPRQLTGRTVLICLIAFFAVIAAVNAFMIRAAVTTFGGVEAKNAYQAGLNYAREIEAARTQDTLHWQVKANVRRSGDGTAITIDARDAAGTPVAGLEAKLTLSHPLDRRVDRDVTLREEATGRFSGATAFAAGQWDLNIELSRDGQRLFRSRNRVVLN